MSTSIAMAVGFADPGPLTRMARLRDIVWSFATLSDMAASTSARCASICRMRAAS